MLTYTRKGRWKANTAPASANPAPSTHAADRKYPRILNLSEAPSRGLAPCLKNNAECGWRRLYVRRGRLQRQADVVPDRRCDWRGGGHTFGAEERQGYAQDTRPDGA